MTVNDNDAAGFTINPASLTVAEPNGEDSFTLSLTSQPADTVTIALSASNGECTVAPASLELTAANWQAGLTATVTAQDDDIVDGPQTCVIETGRARSDDLDYDTLNPPDVDVTVNDNDTAGFTVDPITLAVAEPTGTANFRISLTSQPIDTVSIALTTSNNQCSVGPATLFLTAANWNLGAQATVAAVDDLIDDGVQTCLVQTAPAVSIDPNYNTEDPPNVTVDVSDNDIAGFDVSPDTLSVSEPDGSSDFVIRLTSQPIDTVSIALVPSNTNARSPLTRPSLTATTGSVVSPPPSLRWMTL